MHLMFTGMFGQRSSSHKSFQGISIHRCVGNTQFSTVVDINNDEKAAGNHSEETVVSISVVLLVISRCICIVFSDDLSLLTFAYVASDFRSKNIELKAKYF
jgi:hypothetical protein